MPDMSKRYESSSLFLVRVWSEDAGEGQMEWRGKVQYVLSGEARSFCDWPELVDAMLGLMPHAVSDDGGRGTGDGKH